MSYDMRNDRASRVREANAEFERLQDRERLEFLRALDAAPVDVTPWEERFIETQLVRQHKSETPISFSLDQRAVIDELRREYAGKLNL